MVAEPTAGLRLAPSCKVVVGALGPILPPYGPHPSVGLGPEGLLLLLELAGGRHARQREAIDAVDRPMHRRALVALSRTLQERGLVLRAPPAQEAAAARPSTHGLRSDALPDDEPLVLAVPLALEIAPDGFELLDHDGRLALRLAPAEVCFLARFVQPVSSAVASRDQLADERLPPVHPDRLHEVLVRASRLGVLGALEAEVADRESAWTIAARTRVAVDRHLEAFDRRERRREERTGARRVRVVPVHHDEGIPLALGMLVAHAKSWNGGELEEHYAFRPDWVAHTRPVDELADGPAVFLFSDYIWSAAANRVISEQVKALDDRHVIVHGGPEVPGYDHEVELYFGINPHVDVLVHKEGEITLTEALAALRGSIGDGPADLGALRDVPGLSFRDGDRVVRTGTRDRVADLDSLPSPYLTGVFDALGEARVAAAVVESNRGCPYGCTFCDWGSATLSRIRKFDMARVRDEIEWIARHGISGLSFADANFGIIDRDVDIAAKVCRAREEHGHPKTCFTNFAKNTTRHLSKIVAMWSDAGMISAGNLSLQTLDADTLVAVKRSNIKTSGYDNLAKEFRKQHLPLAVDLMMGLPGATFESFKADMQQCLDRELFAKLYPTLLLRNSPMNEPEYRARHQIATAVTTEEGMRNPWAQMVVATSSYTADDHAEMDALRNIFIVCENFGVLRLQARYVRQETGMLEVDLFDLARRRVVERPYRWPHLAYVMQSARGLFSPPGSWANLTDDVRRFLVQETGVVGDGALDAVLRANHALLEGPGRTFPYSVDLDHDVRAWHHAMLDAKAQFGDAWPSHTTPLRDFGPVRLTVPDVDAISRVHVLHSLDGLETADLVSAEAGS